MPNTHVQRNNSLDSEKMKKFIIDALPKIKPAENRDIVLVVGNTGAGKSTLIDYLLGCKMKKEKRGIRTIAVPEDPKLEVAKIGNNMESETLYSAIYSNSEFSFCDCPGFMENRTEEEKVFTSINMQLAIESAKSVCSIIVVIDIKSLETDKASGMRNLAKTLSLLLKKSFDFSKSVLFVITKTSELSEQDIDVQIGDIYSALEKSLKSSKEGEEQDNLRNELNIIKLVQKSSKIIIDVFDNFTSQKKIFEALRKLKFIDKSIFAFSGFEESRVKFGHVINEVAEQASIALSDKIEIPKVITELQGQIETTTKQMSRLTKQKELHQLITKLNNGEKESEIQDVRLNIEEIGIKADRCELAIKTYREEIKQLRNQLEWLDTSDINLENPYWKEETQQEAIGDFFQYIASYFRLWTTKDFQYHDVPFDRKDVVETCLDGKIDVVKESPETGDYQAIYRSDLFKTGFASVSIFLQRRDIPANKVQIDLLRRSIGAGAFRIEEIQAYKAQLLDDVEKQKYLITLYQSELSKQVTTYNDNLQKLDQRLADLGNKLETYQKSLQIKQEALPKVIEQVDSNRTIYFFVAKISRLLKINSPLVKSFLTYCSEELKMLLRKIDETSSENYSKNLFSSLDLLMISMESDLDEKRNTLLHLAINEKYFAVAILLMLKNATLITTKNSDNYTPIDLLLKLDEGNFTEKAKELLALMLYNNPTKDMQKNKEFKLQILAKRNEFLQRNQSFKKPIESVLADNLSPHTPHVSFDKSVHKRAFKEMYDFPEIAPLLEIVRFAVLGLHDLGKIGQTNPQLLQIVVDPNRDDTEHATLGVTGNAYGVYYNGRNAIYLGGKRGKDPEKSKFLARGTFIHEANHFVANEVFKNSCNPYFATDTISKQRFEKICQSLNQKKNTLHERLRSVFSYHPSLWHIELIVRVSQLIVMTNGYNTVANDCPELLAYYREVFLPACQIHLSELYLKNQILVLEVESTKLALFDKPYEKQSDLSVNSLFFKQSLPPQPIQPPTNPKTTNTDSRGEAESNNNSLLVSSSQNRQR